MLRNRILAVDSYKHSHHLQTPPGTEYEHSYIESRGGIYPKTLFFGLQAFIKEYLINPIDMGEVLEAKEITEAHGEPFNLEGWTYITKDLKGRLPLRIRAVPEGSLVPVLTPLVTVENTNPKCAWLTPFIETALLRAVWYPTQVATTSFRIKRKILSYLESTGTPAEIDFKLVDFGARGCSSSETAALGGLAHLVNFMGTDTMESLLAARRYYATPMAGFSIPASQHSTMTALGREGEVEQMSRMIDQFAGPGKIFACVSDGYDIYNACANIWGGVLKEKVLNSGARLVVRPDSGDPANVVMKVVEILGEKFGHTTNDKGFKVLNPAVRVIQGDGINELSIDAILSMLISRGWSADNVGFGMGGALLQNHTRDDNKWAMKTSAICIDGEWRDVYKDPITDSGKRSKRGRQDHALLRTVYENSKLLIDETLDEIRTRANSQEV